MASLKSFLELAERHRQLDSPIDFVIIYIREAHASDGWRFDGEGNSLVANHRDMEDRIEAIRTLLDLAEVTGDEPVSIYSDTMNDHTNHLFRGWPEKLYVLHDQKIAFQGGNGPSGYSIPSLEYFLKANVVSRK